MTHVDPQPSSGHSKWQCYQQQHPGKIKCGKGGNQGTAGGKCLFLSFFFLQFTSDLWLHRGSLLLWLFCLMDGHQMWPSRHSLASILHSSTWIGIEWCFFWTSRRLETHGWEHVKGHAGCSLWVWDLWEGEPLAWSHMELSSFWFYLILLWD